MTQEEKDLLLKDLCARLPYGVKFMIDKTYLTEDMITSGYDKTQELYGITREGNVELLNMDYHMPIESIKPYLFPLSSMTEEQKKVYYDKYCLSDYYALEKFDWFNKNHLDYRGLIPKGIANDATGLDIY
jgi:hypothetical protein